MSCVYNLAYCFVTAKNKAIIDYTSPALCIPVTPFQADPILENAAATE